MIRSATTSDHKQILEINLEWEHFLAPMDLAKLEKLNELADQLWIVDVEEEVAAFMLVFREGANYDSQNYAWFSERLDLFYYVDRIAMRKEFQGQGIGRQLYEYLFDHARGVGVPIICCEYNFQPLNEGSKEFHRTMKFEEVGRQETEEGKVVSLQRRYLH